VSGDVHGFNAHKITELLLSYCPRAELVLDLSGVKRFSPTGLNALLSGVQFLADAGCRLVLRRPSRTVVAVIAAAGKRDRFDIEYDEQLASSAPTPPSASH
jgi:anti-anti-sigma factor